MDKYERLGRRYAEREGQTIHELGGKIHVYDKDSYNSDYHDKPDDTFLSWKEYARFYIGNELRRKRLRNYSKRKSNKPF